MVACGSDLGPGSLPSLTAGDNPCFGFPRDAFSLPVSSLCPDHNRTAAFHLERRQLTGAEILVENWRSVRFKVRVSVSLYERAAFGLAHDAGCRLRLPISSPRAHWWLRH